MKYPQIKHTAWCRAILYGVPLVICFIGFLPALLEGILPVVFLIVLMFLILFAVIAFVLIYRTTLSAMEVQITLSHNLRSAKTRYKLSADNTTASIRARINDYGKQCALPNNVPSLTAMRYLRQDSRSAYSRGAESVVLSFAVDALDEQSLAALLCSAKDLAVTQWGKEPPRAPSRAQNGALLQRVCVVVLVADRVAPSLRENLFSILQSYTNDELADVFMPCVIDMQENSIVFDSVRSSWDECSLRTGKNRGYRIIRELVFGGVLTPHDTAIDVASLISFDHEESLWALWRRYRREHKLAQQRPTEPVTLKDDCVTIGNNCFFLKHGQRAVWKSPYDGVWLSVILQPETHTAVVDSMVNMYRYERQITDKASLTDPYRITRFFEDYGYTVKFTR